MNKPQSINELSNFAMPTPMPVLAHIVGFTDDDAPLLNLGGQVRPGKMISRLAQLPREELLDRQAVVLTNDRSQLRSTWYMNRVYSQKSLSLTGPRITPKSALPARPF